MEASGLRAMWLTLGLNCIVIDVSARAKSG
jgi:hypothetical protein